MEHKFVDGNLTWGGERSDGRNKDALLLQPHIRRLGNFDLGY